MGDPMGKSLDPTTYEARRLRMNRPPRFKWDPPLEGKLGLTYELWADIVTRYTSCSTTKEADKLVAISGLARQLSETLNDEYIAGLWRSNLVECLCWLVDDPKGSRRPDAYRAPSWSWASVEGSVRYWFLNGTHSQVGIPQVTVEEVSVTPAESGNSFEQIRSGFIKLRGDMVGPIEIKTSGDRACVIDSSEYKMGMISYIDVHPDVPGLSEPNLYFMPFQNCRKVAGVARQSITTSIRLIKPSTTSDDTNEPPTGSQGTPDLGLDASGLAGQAVAAKRRNPVACRRCRRLRSKCIHQSVDPPCDACRLAGPGAASECYFPRRGEKDLDRQFRRRRVLSSDAGRPGGNEHPGSPGSISITRGHPPTSPPSGSSTQRSSEGSSKVHRFFMPAPSFNPEQVLPPRDEVIEGCRIFVTSYFQLGFIPKAVFLEGLIRDPTSVSTFLLTCMLSISARFTPSLAQRYGSPRNATDYFLDLSRAMVPAEMYQPSLERIQAFFLLAICQWGNGDRDRSSMDMGVAVRMAALLKLHCEESYVLEENSPTEQVVRSESARRVFWMIQSQENLHSGYKTPAPFPLEDITTLLPCSEADFAFGVAPPERAALAGTPPGLANPQLVHSPNRCLFATLIQAHGLWGTVARRAGRTGYSVNNVPPWDKEKNMLSALTQGQVDHLSDMPPPIIGDGSDPSHPSHQSSEPTFAGPVPEGFWEKTANELFINVWKLYEQIDAFFTMRAPDEGFPQILVFCVYISGSLASYLLRYPALCPSLADKAKMMAQRSLEVLGELHAAWPTSSKWQKGLQQIATPLGNGCKEHSGI
ncbi:hypothetical protein G7Z17_g2315 [Cylindrodendrum hubeiense]|uniref:Xylanolytic transcriptional activator regulatory domain-containing protein n=1 Tax=Cylindrodendrum hubeiense TaxID=595255 RepID=A0A9P5HEG5_9HYPO|nr:hypothetical protein G7Z17_g2315 [Cylindrodendrum hubeiense]